MKPKAILTTAAMFLVAAAPTALAETYIPQPCESGLWQDPDCWSPPGVPGPGDGVRVPDGYTLTIRVPDAICGWVDVQGTGQIIIDATAGAATLTIDGDGTARTSTLDDGVKIRMIGSNVAALYIKDDNHTFSLSGSTEGIIQGEYNTTKILIDSSVTLTIDAGVTVQGATKIQGGTFVNNGKVLANDATSAGTRDALLFDAGTIGGTGSFEVNTAGATLEFDATGVDATGLYTYFTISAGTLDCETNITSTRPGCLTMTGGTVYVCPEVTVTFN